MAILKAKEVSKMSDSERKTKLNELRMELIKANTPANKSNSKPREIKRTIARILTFSNSALGGKLKRK